MITDLTNSDNAGNVVGKINTAITEQNKGVDPLGADPNASTVITRVNAAITAENNNQLEPVTSSDNAANFIGKVNALFASIRNGGGQPQPTYPDAPSILILGNSFTQDSWSYVPYLLKEYGINIKIGICYTASTGVGGYKSGFNFGPSDSVNRGFFYIDTSKDSEWSEKIAKAKVTYDGEEYRVPTAKQCIQYYEGMEDVLFTPDSQKTGRLWDVIVFQQASTASYLYASYGLLNDSIIPALKEYIEGGENPLMKKEFIYGWNINHTTGGFENDLPTDVLDNIKDTCDKYDIDLVFPYGTAIFNGRNNDTLKQIGYNGNTNLWVDGQHLAGGIPHYLASLAIIETIFRNYYQEEGLTVQGNRTIPNSSWVNGRRMPSGRATQYTGVDSASAATNCSLAQAAAINACNSPWQIYGEPWLLTVIIKTNATCYIDDNGEYTIHDGGTNSLGITTSYFYVPSGTTLTGIVIKPTTGHTIGSSHRWEYHKFEQADFVNHSELDYARGTISLNGDNTKCEIEGIYVDHNIRITIYGTT